MSGFNDVNASRGVVYTFLFRRKGCRTNCRQIGRALEAIKSLQLPTYL